jgi:hypothetical protein
VIISAMGFLAQSPCYRAVLQRRQKTGRFIGEPDQPSIYATDDCSEVKRLLVYRALSQNSTRDAGVTAR